MAINSFISDTAIAYSSAPETAMGNAPLLASAYTSIVTRARILPLPGNRKDDDTGVIGRGSSSMYPSYQRSELMNPITFEIQDRVNVDSFATLLRRHMGAPELVGEIVEVEAAIASKHIFREQNPDGATGRQLPTTAFVYRNNGADFIHPGCNGASATIQQQGGSNPEFTLSFNNGGQYKRIRDITAPAFGTLALPSAQNYMLGADSRVQYTDSTVTRNLVDPDRRIKSVSFTQSNNLDLQDERMGMPSMDGAGCPKKGWYRDYLLFGDRNVSATMRLMVDANILEWKQALEDEVITNWKWDMKGDCIPNSATGSRYGVSLIIPRCQFRDTSGQDDANKAAMDLTIFPELNSLHYGVYRVEVTNGKTTIHD